MVTTASSDIHTDTNSFSLASAFRSDLLSQRNFSKFPFFIRKNWKKKSFAVSYLQAKNNNRKNLKKNQIQLKSYLQLFFSYLQIHSVVIMVSAADNEKVRTSSSIRCFSFSSFQFRTRTSKTNLLKVIFSTRFVLEGERKVFCFFKKRKLMLSVCVKSWRPNWRRSRKQVRVNNRVEFSLIVD